MPVGARVRYSSVSDVVLFLRLSVAFVLPDFSTTFSTSQNHHKRPLPDQAQGFCYIYRFPVFGIAPEPKTA